MKRNVGMKGNVYCWDGSGVPPNVLCGNPDPEPPSVLGSVIGGVLWDEILDPGSNFGS